MAAIANGGTFYQTRLVEQVQTVDNNIVAAYTGASAREVGLTGDIVPLQKGMETVVTSGTAAQARVPGVDVAARRARRSGAATVTRASQRYGGWFVGFAPVDKPQYAFAAFVEGEPGDNGARRRRRGAADRQGAAGDLQG